MKSRLHSEVSISTSAIIIFFNKMSNLVCGIKVSMVVTKLAG